MRVTDGDKISIKVGRTIRERREELNMTQGELAKKLGYKYSNFIGMVENGQWKFPIDRVFQFADSLDIPRHEFLRLIIGELHPDWMPYLSFKPSQKKGTQNPKSQAL